MDIYFLRSGLLFGVKKAPLLGCGNHMMVKQWDLYLIHHAKGVVWVGEGHLDKKISCCGIHRSISLQGRFTCPVPVSS